MDDRMDEEVCFAEEIEKDKKIERMRHAEKRFWFLIQNMCDNFLEINVKTGECVVTAPKNNVKSNKFYDEHVKWIMEHLVLPENRKDYFERYRLSNLIKSIRENDGLYVTEEVVMVRGVKRYSLITNTIIEAENGTEYVFAFAQDVTPLKLQEEESRKMILEALEVAEKASKAKSDFLSRMSHEIRTPMNAIIGLNTLMTKNYDQPDKILDFSSKIEKSSHYMLSLINDILDMSKIESGKLKIIKEPFSFDNFIKNIDHMIRPQADEKGISLEIVSDVQLHVLIWDSVHLNQVIINLLSNALKFTGTFGHIQFSAKEVKRDEKTVWIHFSVKDNGSGIEKEYQKKIFETFEQAGNLGKYRRGTGLGLPICKSILELMDSEIHLDSEPMQGSEFYFTIAMGYSVSGNQIDINELGKCYNFKGKRILVVEDNELNAEITAELLKEVNIQVELVSNGKEAVDIFLKQPSGYFKAILMDIQMPIMNGLEATVEIRKSSRKDASIIPIIGFSANAFSEDVQNAMKSGMTAYTTKPIDIEEICNILEIEMKKNVT